ncbi:flagellar assembly protein FliW [Bacillus sp. DTU_2020_1000418_1_SI_GHA_SEK_038]|uniref:flagellar assembly protein FliW n=1 Tax=Bacillus sp. DTU_2020_1000418_1_SI_GHA_SEK_038 TaxID=3077585 RepID=UPI0028E94B70|nr:flagellar assembly protein FliW [Bacillus sp. DTU_2020_1000418_1_SI_GHA_SEK_038]WNS75087.1 flagellar assembly protein FliW [Bacillus sp. DTU_2020_1000418_1_SI_GHA_SEK_038]
MNIDTKYHDVIEISEEEIWHFEKGIPGFLSEKRFVILNLPENDVFSIMQSVTTPNLAFVITNPFQFFQDYQFSIDDLSIKQLEIETDGDVLSYVILTVQEPFDQTTANLQAPLIFNKKNKYAKQLILSDSSYQTKHLLTPAYVSKG